ncbi:gliding motility protein GldM [Chryseolinea lacunae]|uniref:Gliding motility protein GldM n=1 Tax=Chryseolinea lacunae TaxID=2801331 RepID=A0ABS1KRS4_9BACT|nr:gliding motility protein GldM [Chryseolinea lacunae]MBL0742149.1 gliding motility protein GldM [Chryseolinea lacunae]
MAGGKETPRQKMIGMMYLVLTALLALQVSNAVLEKFAIINNTLDGVILDATQKNSDQLGKIVSDGGKSDDAAVKQAVDNAKKVRELAQNTVTYINEVKKKMLDKAESQKIDEKFINNHSSAVATMMIDKDGGTGTEFVKRLEEYRKSLESLTGDKFETLAKPPSQLDAFKDNNKHANKDFLTFTFENTPPVAAYASVTQIQTEVLAYESRALNILAEKAGAEIVKFDQIVPMVRPVSSVVAAGATYEADMFITASASGLTPEMYYNGAKLQIADEGGIKMGKVKFTAKGGNYDKDGYSKQSFKAKIMIDGKPYEKDVTYLVAQPIIKVTTGNAPTLYMNCGNTVNIEVPALGTTYNPSFSGASAEIRKGAKPGAVVIIPSARRITVGVSSGGTKIGDQIFDVKNVPDPRYIAYIGSTPVDLRNGIKPNQIANLRFVAEPENNFKEEVPKDARYKIKRAEVILGRGTAGVQRMNATNENPDLRAWSSQARPGDRIIIDIKEVSRRTFTDSEEKVSVKGSSGIITVPIN